MAGRACEPAPESGLAGMMDEGAWEAARAVELTGRERFAATLALKEAAADAARSGRRGEAAVLAGVCAKMGNPIAAGDGGPRGGALIPVPGSGGAR